jgi:hypothetical protein
MLLKTDSVTHRTNHAGFCLCAANAERSGLPTIPKEGTEVGGAETLQAKEAAVEVLP